MAVDTLPRRRVNATGNPPAGLSAFPHGAIALLPRPANDRRCRIPSVAAVEWDGIVRAVTDLPPNALLLGIRAGIGAANDAIVARDERVFYRRMLSIYAIAARVLMEGGELPGAAS